MATILLLNDIYNRYCTDPSSPDTLETRSMRRFVEIFNECTTDSSQCPAMSRKMRNATSDCEFVRATLEWMNQQDQDYFYSLTQNNLQTNLDNLSALGISEADLLELNQLAKEPDDEPLRRRMRTLFDILQQNENVSQSATLFQSLALATLARIPPTIGRETDINTMVPRSVVALGTNGSILIASAQLPESLIADPNVLYKGEVLFNDGNGQKAKLVPAIVDLSLGVDVPSLPMPNDAQVIGLIIREDWMLIDVNSGQAFVQSLDGASQLETNIENFATRSVHLQDGDVGVTLGNGETWVIHVIPIPIMDTREREKERVFLDILEANVRMFPEETNGWGTL